MITTSEYSMACPKKAMLSRTYKSIADSDSVNFGSAFHRATATGEISTEDEEIPLLKEVFERWKNEHLPRYMQGKMYHEVGFNLKLNPLKLTKKPMKSASITSVIDTIVIGDEDIFIYERKTTSRSVPEMANKYLSGHQLKMYNLLAFHLKELTNKNIVLFLDIIKKKVPTDLHLNSCRKKHIEGNYCPDCKNTGYIKISSQAVETTVEKYDEVFLKYPHLKTEEAISQRELAKQNSFGEIYSLPLQIVDRDFITSLQWKHSLVNKKNPHEDYSQCPECGFYNYCYHGIEPEVTNKPDPINNLTDILEVK